MSRAKWKGFYLNSNYSNILNGESVNQKQIWSRNSIITEDFLGKTVLIYNGKSFISVKITREKIGYKFGEFSFTRKIKDRTLEHVKSKQKGKKNK
jgi:small subunit ribosomal protein S19